MSECYMVEDTNVVKYNKQINIENDFGFNRNIYISFRACNLSNENSFVSAWYKIINGTNDELYPATQKNKVQIISVTNNKIIVNNNFPKELLKLNIKILEIYPDKCCKQLPIFLEYETHSVDNNRLIFTMKNELDAEILIKIIPYQSSIAIHDSAASIVTNIKINRYPAWKYLETLVDFSEISFLGKDLSDGKNFPKYLEIYFRVSGSNISALISNINVYHKIN